MVLFMDFCDVEDQEDVEEGDQDEEKIEMLVSQEIINSVKNSVEDMIQLVGKRKYGRKSEYFRRILQKFETLVVKYDVEDYKDSYINLLTKISYILIMSEVAQATETPAMYKTSAILLVKAFNIFYKSDQAHLYKMPEVPEIMLKLFYINKVHSPLKELVKFVSTPAFTEAIETLSELDQGYLKTLKFEENFDQCLEDKDELMECILSNRKLERRDKTYQWIYFLSNYPGIYFDSFLEIYPHLESDAFCKFNIKPSELFVCYVIASVMYRDVAAYRYGYLSKWKFDVGMADAPMLNFELAKESGTFCIKSSQIHSKPSQFVRLLYAAFIILGYNKDDEDRQDLICKHFVHDEVFICFLQKLKRLVHLKIKELDIHAAIETFFALLLECRDGRRSLFHEMMVQYGKAIIAAFDKRSCFVGTGIDGKTNMFDEYFPDLEVDRRLCKNDHFYALADVVEMIKFLIVDNNDMKNVFEDDPPVRNTSRSKSSKDEEESVSEKSTDEEYVTVSEDLPDPNDVDCKPVATTAAVKTPALQKTNVAGSNLLPTVKNVDYLQQLVAEDVVEDEKPGTSATATASQQFQTNPAPTYNSNLTHTLDPYFVAQFNENNRIIAMEYGKLVQSLLHKEPFADLPIITPPDLAQELAKSSMFLAQINQVTTQFTNFANSMLQQHTGQQATVLPPRPPVKEGSTERLLGNGVTEQFTLAYQKWKGIDENTPEEVKASLVAPSLRPEEILNYKSIFSVSGNPSHDPDE